MNIAGIEKLSLVDFPGNLAATLFTSGCNFRCPFCHNGELVGSVKQLLDTKEVLDYLCLRSKMISGVCISGGEPTLQSDLKEFIKEIKSYGLKVKLDTNGTNPALLQNLIEEGLLDYVAMDIKNSIERYALTAGVDNLNTQNILKSINLLINSNIDYEFRTTLVLGHHTTESISILAKMLSGAKKLVFQRFIDRETCIKSGLKEVPLEKAQEFKEICQKYINFVTLRGYNN